MFQIRISLNWIEETDPELLLDRLKQDGLEEFDTGIGLKFYRRNRSIVALRYGGKVYFKPNNAPVFHNIHTAPTPPSRAQRTPGMIWVDLSGNEPVKRIFKDGKWEPILQ